MLLPTDECFAQEVAEPVHDGLTCPKYAVWDSNPGSGLAKEHKSRLHFGGRHLLLLSPADFRRFLIVLVDTSIWQPVLLEYETGCEWHPYNQTLQCPVITIRCCPWSVGSWQIFHIVGLCLFSHQSTDYIIVVAHLMSNSFEGHPCCMYANYLPSLCF